MVVATRPFSQSEVKKVKIAVPGTLTTAYLALKLLRPALRLKSCLSIRSSRQFSRGNTKRE